MIHYQIKETFSMQCYVRTGHVGSVHFIGADLKIQRNMTVTVV